MYITFLINISDKPIYIEDTLQSLKTLSGNLRYDIIIVSSYEYQNLLQSYSKIVPNTTIILENGNEKNIYQVCSNVVTSDYVIFLKGTETVEIDGPSALVNLVTQNKVEVGFGSLSNNQNINLTLETIIPNPLEIMLRDSKNMLHIGDKMSIVSRNLINKYALSVNNYAFALKCASEGPIGYIPEHIAVERSNLYFDKSYDFYCRLAGILEFIQEKPMLAEKYIDLLYEKLYTDPSSSMKNTFYYYKNKFTFKSKKLNLKKLEELYQKKVKELLLG